MDNYEYTELLKTLNTKVENIAGVVKPENIKARLKEIEELENDQNLWQDIAKAG
ncbi:MAG: peptide chain release factor 2, partial [Campylobacter sp.]